MIIYCLSVKTIPSKWSNSCRKTLAAIPLNFILCSFLSSSSYFTTILSGLSTFINSSGKDKLDEMESKLNEQIDRNVALNRRLAESNADGVFAAVAEGLADTQKEKLATLAENVEFESETDYREKLETLKESYFPSKTSAPKSTSENLSEEVSTDEVISEEVAPRMQAYLDVLSRAAKK